MEQELTLHNSDVATPLFPPRLLLINFKQEFDTAKSESDKPVNESCPSLANACEDESAHVNAAFRRLLPSKNRHW